MDIKQHATLINQWIKEEIRKYLETNENGNTTYQNLWDTAKAIPRGKFIVINTYTKRQDRSQVNNLTIPQVTGKRTYEAQ